jgi:hypothetical protein
VKSLAIVVSLFLICLCICWVYSKPGFDSWAGLGAALVSLTGSFFLQSAKPRASQIQKVQSGNAIQGGRDVKINQNDDR